MAAQRVRIVSNFKAAADAGDDAIAELIAKGTALMHEQASRRLDGQAGQRGYNLYSTDLSYKVGIDEGIIEYGQFYGRFFEYGTPTIQAMPFMRPGARAGRTYVKTAAPGVFDRWMRRKAQVRR
jgi:hypothetical protein